VIEEPIAAPPPRSRRIRIELVTAAAFAVLLAGALGPFPALREGAVEGARSAVDRIFPGTWTAYYIEVDATDPRAQVDPEEADSRLMFASGSLPGRAARLLSDRVHTGTWSPNGERFIASSGTRLLLGDRDGQVKQLTDLRDLHPTAPAIWNGDGELLVSVTRDGRQQWLVRLDSRSGGILDQRDLAMELAPYALSPDGKWMLAVDQRAGSGVLYEHSTKRLVTAGQGESFAAWLADGRVLVSVIDDAGTHLSARRPEGGSSETIVDLDGVPLLPAVAGGGRVAIVEAQTGDPTGPRAIWLITPGETPVRVAKDLGRVYFPKPSRDGRYVGFSEVRPGTGPVKVRTGMIEVATKRVSYACDAGCAVLDVR
jgi:hypothetical protein